MSRFIAYRFLRMLISLLLVVTFVFFILRLIGDPMEILVPPDFPQEERELLQQELGLDKPIVTQYAIYIKKIVTGDFGKSFVNRRPVIKVIGERVPKTLLLGGCSFLFALVLGVPLGILSALKRGKFFDHISSVVSVFSYSLPNYFLGILLILLFSIFLRWLPSSGSGGFNHLILPVITMGTAIAARIFRFSRSSMLEVLNQKYILASKTRGISWFRTVFFHALPNASIPIVTIIGFYFALIISGSAVVETVFGWPGIGRLLVSSITKRDLNVVQALVVIIGVAVAVGNFIIDLLYGVLDPRISISGKKG